MNGCPIGYCDTTHSPQLTCYEAVRKEPALSWGDIAAVVQLLIVMALLGCAALLAAKYPGA